MLVLFHIILEIPLLSFTHMCPFRMTQRAPCALFLNAICPFFRLRETLKIFIPPIKKPRRKLYLYQKGDYESMRKDMLEFAKEKYFNGHSDTRSVQENFDLLTSFIQDSADKHIPSKTSRSVSSVPLITPEIRRKIRR